jgi:hypothetical protein
VKTHDENFRNDYDMKIASMSPSNGNSFEEISTAWKKETNVVKI